MRVRMGLHTGEAEVRQDDYVGLDVHRAARICAAGHGGQVLISSSTRELVADELPSDVALRDLGEHRLKDLDRPEQLFQLVVGDLPAEFPPLASLSPGSGAANGLPRSPNQTIGRADDVGAIAARVGVGGVRLLTLTGPGGVGKTRLGLEAARAVKADFADGAYFVSLAALRRPEDVPAAIVKALAIVVLSGESADQAAERFLAAKHLLLVLDNFEHVLAAAPFIGRLLEACPALTVLATSREPLALHAEERYPVAPLALPPRATREDAEALAGADAVALFCERARPTTPTSTSTMPTPPRSRRSAGASTGCRWRSSWRPPAAGCCHPARSPSAWTTRSARWAPAPATRPRASRRCARRSTGATSCSATPRSSASRASRCSPAARRSRRPKRSPARGLDTLDSLVAKSLLVRRQHAARAHRGSGCSRRSAPTPPSASRPRPTSEAVRERHYRYYLALAQRHGTERALWGAGGNEHLARLDAEIDNLHAALGWAIGQADAERALAMAAALGCVLGACETATPTPWTGSTRR